MRLVQFFLLSAILIASGFSPLSAEDITATSCYGDAKEKLICGNRIIIKNIFNLFQNC